jgi:hypothetical protein
MIVLTFFSLMRDVLREARELQREMERRHPRLRD